MYVSTVNRKMIKMWSPSSCEQMEKSDRINYDCEIGTHWKMSTDISDE